MVRGVRWVLIVGGVALALLGGSAGAGPAPDASAPASQTATPLDLSIRSAPLGVETLTPTLDSLGLGPMRAPTGGGSSRAPSTTTQIGRGVYLTVDPNCYPGEDLLRHPIRPRR